MLKTSGIIDSIVTSLKLFLHNANPAIVLCVQMILSIFTCLLAQFLEFIASNDVSNVSHVSIVKN